MQKARELCCIQKGASLVCVKHLTNLVSPSRDREANTGRMDGRLTPTGRTDSKLVRIKVGPQLTCAKGVGTFWRQPT